MPELECLASPITETLVGLSCQASPSAPLGLSADRQSPTAKQMLATWSAVAFREFRPDSAFNSKPYDRMSVCFTGMGSLNMSGPSAISSN